MAATMRCLIKLNMGLASNTLLRNSLVNSCRYLYSSKSLGLQGYENARLNFRNQFLNVETTFRNKMEEVCNTDSSVIFTEDLKSMLHLAEKNPKDIQLLIKMLTKFNSQAKDMRFGTFIFGPVVMRTFYYLDEPDLAITAFKNPEFELFFDQLISYQILLSLMYKHGKYAEMRSVYDIIKKKPMVNGGYARNSLILIMAACYKENTPETLKYGLKIWQELTEKGFEIIRRATIFLAALAIKQNVPHIAIEILSSLREFRYIQIRNMKVAAYTELKRFTDIVPIFRSSLEHDSSTHKQGYFIDVIEKLEEAMAKENIPEDFEVYKLIALLKRDDYILQETLDDHICAEINIDRMKARRSDTMMPQTNFRQGQRNFTRNINNSPTMRDFL